MGSPYACDRIHEEQMRDGSRKLLEAILAARAGTHPGTPTRPFRLPK